MSVLTEFHFDASYRQTAFFAERGSPDGTHKHFICI